MKKTLSQILYVSGGILSVMGSVGYLLNIEYASYVFSFGAALLIYLQFMHYRFSPVESVRMQRLKRISFLSSLLLGLSAYYMFVNSNSWVVAVLIYALTTLFVSFRGEKN